MKTETLTTIPANGACHKHKNQSIKVKNLEMLVKDYLCEYKNSYNPEDRWWAESSTWEKALERAWNSRLENGRMHPHQCHVAHKLPEGLKIALAATYSLTDSQIFTSYTLG